MATAAPLTSRKATAAAPEVLAAHGAKSVSSEVDGDEVTVGQWTFKSKHQRMLDSNEMIHLAADIATTIGGTTSSEDHVAISGHTLRLPAMVFGKDTFDFSYAAPSSHSPFSISLNALDALSCWAAQHSTENKEHVPLRIVQVPYAESWVGRHQSVIMAETATAISAGGTNNTTRTDPSTPPVVASCAVNIWDWTFSSDYCCTVGVVAAPGTDTPTDTDTVQTIASARALSAERRLLSRGESAFSPSKIGWQKRDASGINYDLLRMRNVPILFYDELLLYQDDLEDCGDVVFDAKLRVMPHCWFVLSRFFVRVDGSVVRIRDTRLFHRFGDAQVYMDVSWKEQSLLPTAAPHKDADLPAAGGGRSIKLSSPPQPPLNSNILRNPAQLAEILPVINEAESIHQFFCLDLCCDD